MRKMSKRSLGCFLLLTSPFQVIAGADLSADTSGLATIEIVADGSHKGLEKNLASCSYSLIKGSTDSRSFTLTNTSANITAYNIHPDLTGMNGAAETSNTCDTVLPKKSCTITLTAGGATAPTASAVSVSFSGTNITPFSVLMNVVPPLAVNQIWQGGVILSVDAGGSSGTVVFRSNRPDDPTNPGEFSGEHMPWAFSETDITGATSNTDGVANTNAIIANQGVSPNYAAGRCVSLVATDSCGRSYGNWYLPAINELITFLTLATTNGGPLTNVPMAPFDSDYWSSTQFNVERAVVQNQSLGGPFIALKILDGEFVHTACMRKFTYNS